LGKVRQYLFGTHDPYLNPEPILPLNAHGWASHSVVFAEYINIIKPELIIEVGTWMGASARHMANLAIMQNPNVEVVCVDTFLGSEEHWRGGAAPMVIFENGRPNVYRQFLSNIIQTGLQNIITPFPIDSINAAVVIKRAQILADIIYIDAAHDYESVKLDLKNWLPILRPGGVLIGDDINYGPVATAAAEMVPGYMKKGEKFVWIKPL